MTRKRFIKLMMSRRISRNEARVWAWMVKAARLWPREFEAAVAVAIFKAYEVIKGEAK